MKVKKVVVFHPTGNANVRYLIDGLAARGMLSAFYTCVAVFENTILFKILKKTPLKEFTKRTFSPAVKPFTRSKPFMEIVRIAGLKFGFKNLVKHETGSFSVDAVYHDLDRNVARKLNDQDAVYGYEDGALYSFEQARKKGIICLYDLPIGYWRSMRELLENERTQRPDWADTLTGFKDSEIKLKRKDEELAAANHIFVASSFTKKTLELYPGKLAPIHVIPYGFPKVNDTRTYKPVTGRKIKLLFVGGLSQRKGIANLFEAVEELKDYVTLTVVGKKASETCIPLNEGLEKHTWIPALPYNEVLALMQEHDVFVFPSLFEGYGLVISEAMSQGTPVIATDRTCAADFVEDNKNGWLVEAGSTVSLINKLKYIIENPDEIEKVGRAGAATARQRPSILYGEEMVKAIATIL
jgi:glycosyltransferase involved in cell wall biosynthesis